jgi:hypothetical protein
MAVDVRGLLCIALIGTKARAVEEGVTFPPQ